MQTVQLSPYFIDRASHLREDDVWIKSQLGDPSTRFITVHKAAILCHNDRPQAPYFLSVEQANPDPQESVFLARVDGINYFSLPILKDEDAEQLCERHNAHFQDHASRAPMMESDYRDLLSLACFSTYWHNRNRHCGSCGSPTKMGSAGHTRSCLSETCAQKYFPSMDPAVIVLIEHENRCLLGRQKHWPEGMHSTLAGFVEPGETIEAAVAREVKEEAGIYLEDIRYHSSQAWLFPNSLMLGFTAKAITTELHIDPTELETAAWFTRDQVRACPEMLPNQSSISYALIQDWLNR